MRSELSLLEKQIYDVASGPFNINSPQQISEVLFERLKIETHTKKDGDGSAKTGKDILTELVGAHPIVPSYFNTEKRSRCFLDS